MLWNTSRRTEPPRLPRPPQASISPGAAAPAPPLHRRHRGAPTFPTQKEPPPLPPLPPRGSSRGRPAYRRSVAPGSPQGIEWRAAGGGSRPSGRPPGPATCPALRPRPAPPPVPARLCAGRAQGLGGRFTAAPGAKGGKTLIGGGGEVTGPETNRAGKGPGSARAAASSTRGPLSALRTGLRPPRLNLTEVAALGPGSERGSPCPP